MGFSLIELLIVVAIIAALVGVAVPFFQDNLADAQRAKAGQDLEVLRRAVALYEQREQKLLTGTSLKPLLGRYVAEIPVDPWGNPYLWEGSAGFLGTYGADALPGGQGGDADLLRGGHTSGSEVFVVVPVFPLRVQYQGRWGRPRPPGNPSRYADGSKLVVTFSRPVDESDPDLTPQDLLLQDPASGLSFPMSDSTTWLPDTWRSAADTAWGSDVDPLHRPELAVLVIRAAVDNSQTVGTFGVRPDTRFNIRNLDDDFPAVSAGTPMSLKSTYTSAGDPASPLDPSVYGPLVEEWHTFVGGPPDDDFNDTSGLRIERY